MSKETQISETEKEFHLTTKIKLFNIDVNQDRLNTDETVNINKDLVLFIPEQNTEFIKFYNHYLNVNIFDDDDFQFSDNEYEFIALIAHPIFGAVRLALNLPDKKHNCFYFSLMSVSAKKYLLKMNTQNIVLNILKPSDEKNYDV